MQHETIAFPADADYHDSNQDISSTVFRVHGDTGRYACHYYDFQIGELGGEYDSLLDSRRITLTRKQVSDLAQHLIGLLAARPA